MAEITGKSPKAMHFRFLNPIWQDIEVPVIGGHAGVTIMPVFSQDAEGYGPLWRAECLAGSDCSHDLGR